MAQNDANENFLKQVPDDRRESARKLLKAQQEGLLVSIEEGGVIGSTTGLVSDLRVVNGQLMFKIDGENYNPFYCISVELLSAPTEIRAPESEPAAPVETEKLTAGERKRLLDLCVDIEAHNANDWEITLGGNSANAFEASRVSRAVMAILGVPFDSKFEAKVSKRGEKLKKTYGA